MQKSGSIEPISKAAYGPLDRPRAMQITNSAIGIDSVTHDSASQMPSSTSAKINPPALSIANTVGIERIWPTVCRVLF